MFKSFSWKKNRLVSTLVAFSLALVIAGMSPAIASSLTLGQLMPIPNAGNGSALPAGVERRGNLEAVPIRLDGQELFRIASPAVFNRNDPGNQIPVEIRAKQIEDNLQRLVQGNPSAGEPALDPESLQVLIDDVNGQPVLFVRDAKLAEARVILTVTDSDAQYNGTSKQRLALQWQQTLQQELQRAIRGRQPEVLQQQIYLVGKVLVAAVLLTVLLGTAWSFLERQRKRLKQQVMAEAAAIRNQEMTTVAATDDEIGFLAGVRRRHLGLAQRQQLVALAQWLLFWLIVLLWVGAIAFSLSAFPQTRFFARRVAAIPFVILLAWFFTGLTNRLIDLMIDRFMQSQEKEKVLTEASLQRVSTIAKVVKSLKTALIYALVFLWVLQWLNLVPASILTLGAVVALVVSFGVQSLVKDFVNGFLILLEDQFRIGDNIKVNEFSGMVENLNLRITQLRSDDGNLITLPNSLITHVENRSRGWARADFRIEVAYDTDVDRALAIVKETIETMAQDPQWKDQIFNTHELFGVDQLSHTGIVIRVWIRTAPLQQWNVARELRRRIQIAFQKNKIQIGMPQQLIHDHGVLKKEGVEPTPNSDEQ